MFRGNSYPYSPEEDMSAFQNVTAAMLTAATWTRRNVLSTARPATQVFVVDAIVTFAASYLLFQAFSYMLHGHFRTYSFNTGTVSLMVFMAMGAGAIGYKGARELKQDTQELARSVRRTIAWSAGTPVAITLTLAAAAEAHGDWRGMLVIFALIAPALSVFGYRMMGFRPTTTGADLVVARP